MRRLVWSQFRHRPGRSASLGLAILVAAVSFTLLTASASTSALKVRGTLKSSFRPAYDILVRPPGAETALERRENLVRPNFLSGVYGGITLKQWHRIEQIPGVAVAAPSANVGYALFTEELPFSIKRYVNDSPRQLYRETLSYVTSDGGSHYPSVVAIYFYYHPGPLSRAALKLTRPSVQGEVEPPLACLGFNNSLPQRTSPFAVAAGLNCSAQPGQATNGVAEVTFPVKLAAIDPAQEARLLSLDHTLVSGRYLSERESVRVVRDTQTGARFRALPVIASSRAFLGERATVTVSRLAIPPGVDPDRMLASGGCLSTFVPCPAGHTEPAPKGSKWKNAYQFVTSLPAQTIAHESFPIQSAYSKLLSTTSGELGLGSYWLDSPIRYRTLGPDQLEPLPVHNPLSIWTYNGGAASSAGVAPSYLRAPSENEDVQFRRLHQVYGTASVSPAGVARTPIARVVGRYDPEKLRGFSPLSQVPLETYYPPELTAANTASAKALNGKPLLPTQNLGGYIAQPPLMLTNLSSFESLLERGTYTGVPAAERRAPRAAIRVKVAGVSGPDPLSLEQIKVVAQKIHAETGLAVDITAGSSPHPVDISLPKGKFGRPALLLKEGWSKKGVTVSFLRALDRKDVALFALILVVCGFFLGNGAFAAVRTRRGELGALLTLGWSPAEIFRIVLGELALVGLAAGLAGTGLAAGLVAGFSLHFPLLRTLYVLPIAVGLAVGAGLVPAWRAARGRPLDAIRPPVVGGGHGRRVRGIFGMALVNLGRLPGRTLVGAAGLLLGVAALTVLVGIERDFQGTLVGTVLGSAISLQVRGTDFVALGLTLALSALSAADVLYLNLRERQAELVTLQTLGWSGRETRLLVELEALLLAFGAGLVGAAAGILIGRLILGVALGPLALGAAISAASALAAAFLSSLLPLLRLRRLAAPEVLAAE